MFQRLLKRVVTPALFGAATIVVASSSAEANWGSYGSWGSSTGASSGGRSVYASYGSSGGSWSSHGSWGSHGSHGSSGGILSNIRNRVRNNIDYRQARRAARRSWYSSGGSSGGYASYSSHGSWGGSSGGASSGGASSGSWGSNGSTGGSVSYSYYSSNAGMGSRVSMPTPSLADGTSDAILSVSLPEDATVYVNNKQTTTPGAVRRYVSRNLVDGQPYTYEVRAEVVRNGETLTQTKVVDLIAGSEKEIDFNFETVATAEPETSTDDELLVSVSAPLVTTLHLTVPENATVTLSGSETRMTGSDRVFSTTQLKHGESWDNYQIVVEFSELGQIVQREQTITLVAGETYELSFVGETADVVASN